MTTYAQAIAQAEHRLAIGATEVSLGSADGIDWSQCVGVSRSGGGMPPDALFTFADQGLHLRWYLELQERGTHASFTPAIDVDAVGRVLAALPSGCAARRDFGELLRSVASEIDQRADAALAMAQRDYGAAATLRKLTPPENEEVPF
jgi:hypothetical protein